MLIWIWKCLTVSNSSDDIKFLQIFKQRLIDCCAQEWSEEVQANSKLSYYYLFKVKFMKKLISHVLKINSLECQ